MVIKKNLFENLSIAGLIIVTLAFHDKTKLMVFFQIFAFVIQIINNIDNTRFKFNFLLKKYLNWELLFILYCFFSYFWSLNSGTLFNWLISLFQVIIIGISIIMYCNSNERITNVYKYMMLSCFVLVIRLLILVPLDVWGNGERIGLYIGSDSSGGYGNTSLTYVLSIGSIFALYYGIYNKKIIGYVLFGLFTVFSLLSGSKKAILILFITIILIAILKSKNIIQYIKYLIISFIVLGIAIFIIMNNSVLYNSVGIRFEYFLGYFSGGKTDASTQTRMEYFFQALDFFKKYPLFGIGLDGFRHFNSREAWAENNYMELLADLGLFGSFLYYYFPFSIFIKAIKVKDVITILFFSNLLLIIDPTMVTYGNEFIQIYLVFVYVLFNKEKFLKYNNNLLKDKK